MSHFGWLAIISKTAFAQLNFAVLGNWGAGSWVQKQVASSLSSYCGEKNCSFVVSPGSNFVNGVTGLQDNQFMDSFVHPYSLSNLKLPFYLALGQADWRTNVTAQALWSQLQFGQMQDGDERLQRETDSEGRIVVSQKEIAATNGPKFMMPNWDWHQTVNFQDASTNAIFGASDQTVAFLFIDTYMLSDSFPDEALRADAWNTLDKRLAATKGAFDWVIVVGDTSIYSSGKNGSSKEMESNLRPVLKAGGADAYLSGSDYDMEILEDGNMALLNCGNGSSASGKGLWTGPGSVHFVGSPGFCAIKLSKSTMTLSLIDGATGNILHEIEHKRQEKSINPFAKANALSKMPKVVFKALPWGLGGSVGPNGEGNLQSPAVISFIKTVGTIGLCTASFTTFIAMMTSANRVQKMLA